MAEPNIMKNGSVGFWSIVSIGIGGMVGGGIFAVLGLAVQLGRGGTPIAFALAGLVAWITSYSYAHLSVTFPSQGGTVEFLNQGFGNGLFTGGMNVLLWISYVVMLSLYAYAFGSYGASFFPVSAQLFWKHVLLSGVILLFAALNVLGATFVGRAEEGIVGIKIIILLVFISVGLWSVNLQKVRPAAWTSLPQLVAGGMIIFLAYEGFELIANTAADVRNARRNLPRAFYTAVLFVLGLYVLISFVTVGNLDVADIVAAKDYALAVSARPFLGNAGFALVAAAALLSTASAINATLYGTARVSYIIAKDGELPRVLEKKVWSRPVEGLLMTMGVTLVIANFFDISRISVMGSAGFLLIFASVNGANVRLHKKTASRKEVSWIGLIVCVSAFAVLLWQRALTSPGDLIVLAAMVFLAFAIEVIYRNKTGRKIRPFFIRHEPEEDSANMPRPQGPE
jgi:amino acid transporter